MTVFLTSHFGSILGLWTTLPLVPGPSGSVRYRFPFVKCILSGHRSEAATELLLSLLCSLCFVALGSIWALTLKTVSTKEHQCVCNVGVFVLLTSL